jgi:hypothetical protein
MQLALLYLKKEIKKQKMGRPMKRVFQRSQFYIFLSVFLIGCGVPYLLDVAFCEELYGTPFLQVALIDGETVDPCEGDTVSTSLDGWTTGDLRLSPISFSLASQLSLEACSFRFPSLSISASRAPPLTQ